jgi:hypothetical protein
MTPLKNIFNTKTAKIAITSPEIDWNLQMRLSDPKEPLEQYKSTEIHQKDP